MTSQNILLQSNYDFKPFLIANDLKDNYTIDFHPAFWSDETYHHAMQELFRLHLLSSHSTATNQTPIRVVSCQADHNGAFQLRTFHHVQNITALTRFGYLTHHQVSSIDQFNQQLQSGAEKILVRGHGGFWFNIRGEQQIKHKIRLYDGRVQIDLFGIEWLSAVLNWMINQLLGDPPRDFSVDQLAQSCHPKLTEMIISSCSGGAVRFAPWGRRQRPMGSALDFAHRYPGVSVTGDVSISNSALIYPQKLKADGMIRPEIKHVGNRRKRFDQTFCTRQGIDYRSLSELKSAADQLRQDQDQKDPGFQHLIHHTKLTFEELTTLQRYLQKQENHDALELFKQAPFYRSFHHYASFAHLCPYCCCC